MRFFQRMFGRKTKEFPKQQSQFQHEQKENRAPTEDPKNGTFRFLAIDVETANSDPYSICQIGVAMLDERGTVSTIGLLIDPETHFDTFNSDLHGIDHSAIRGAPTFPTAIESLRSFLERHPLIQHSNFDKKALAAACGRYGLNELRVNWHDSVTIARHAWPKLKGNGGHGLANLKSFLNLDFKHHDAEEDARAAAMIVALAEKETGQTFDALSRPRKNRRYPEKISAEGKQDGPLFGQIACFTGKLALSRTEAATLAAGAGISVRAGVTKKTTLLIVGDQDLTLLAGHSKSSKHRRAEELISQGQRIRIICESEFVELIGK